MIAVFQNKVSKLKGLGWKLRQKELSGMIWVKKTIGWVNCQLFCALWEEIWKLSKPPKYWVLELRKMKAVSHLVNESVSGIRQMLTLQAQEYFAVWMHTGQVFRLSITCWGFRQFGNSSLSLSM